MQSRAGIATAACLIDNGSKAGLRLMRRYTSTVSGRAVCVVLAGIADNAWASFLSGEALDSAANVLSWIVLVLVPVVGIAVFWLVHVLPEKIAYKRHHPQAQAIHTLCLLSLVFGGLLWPIAWLWAYTRPVAYKLAYGTERSEDYFVKAGAKARAGELTEHELAGLKAELDVMHSRGALSPELQKLREELAHASPVAAEPEPKGA
jgi:CBS domain containing-hemolysin-like protein